MAVKPDRVDELGIERVTIHNTKVDGEAEIAVSAWEEPTTKDYESYEDRGWKLGALPVKSTAGAGNAAGKEG